MRDEQVAGMQRDHLVEATLRFRRAPTRYAVPLESAPTNHLEGTTSRRKPDQRVEYGGMILLRTQAHERHVEIGIERPWRLAGCLAVPFFEVDSVQRVMHARDRDPANAAANSRGTRPP